MFPQLYLKLGIYGLVIVFIGGAYYKNCYSPKAKIEKKYEKSSKELRELYEKNNKLETDLNVCMQDINIGTFEGDMKGAADAINDINSTTVSDKLIF